MKTFTVVIAPEAEEDNLVELYSYIADEGSLTVAKRYTDAIIGSCKTRAWRHFHIEARDVTTSVAALRLGDFANKRLLGWLPLPTIARRLTEINVKPGHPRPSVLEGRPMLKK